jgi:hypothetical protein
MPSDIPRRLRRTAVGSGPPPPEVLVRAGLIPDLTPVQVVGGEVTAGTSHPGAGHASCIAGHFTDTANVEKRESPRVNEKAPFTLGK